MGGLAKAWYALLFILILGLFFYDNVWWIDYSNSIKDSERETQLFGKITNISEDHFYMYSGSSNVRIESPRILVVTRAIYGETVAHILAKADGTLEGIDYHNYNYNYLLYLVSFIALIIFSVIFFREWKLTPRGFEDA